eukprot:1158598-Pelagomonas_calceolata.AAC.3
MGGHKCRCLAALSQGALMMEKSLSQRKIFSMNDITCGHAAVKSEEQQRTGLAARALSILQGGGVGSKSLQRTTAKEDRPGCLRSSHMAASLIWGGGMDHKVTAKTVSAGKWVAASMARMAALSQGDLDDGVIRENASQPCSIEQWRPRSSLRPAQGPQHQKMLCQGIRNPALILWANVRAFVHKRALRPSEQFSCYLTSSPLAIPQHNSAHAPPWAVCREKHGDSTTLTGGIPFLVLLGTHNPSVLVLASHTTLQTHQHNRLLKLSKFKSTGVPQ